MKIFRLRFFSITYRKVLEKIKVWCVSVCRSERETEQVCSLSHRFWWRTTEHRKSLVVHWLSKTIALSNMLWSSLEGSLESNFSSSKKGIFVVFSQKKIWTFSNTILIIWHRENYQKQRKLKLIMWRFCNAFSTIFGKRFFQFEKRHFHNLYA